MQKSIKTWNDLFAIGFPTPSDDDDEITIPTGTWIDSLRLLLGPDKYQRPSVFSRDEIMLADWSDIDGTTINFDTGTWIDELA